MGNIQPSYNDRVQYTLKNEHLGSLIVTEPIGWESDEKEYARHEQYHGIVAKFSNSSKFIGSAKEFIQTVKDMYGINAQIELIREEKHPETDFWTLTYSGYLDLSTWSKENNKISLKFNSGGLVELLKSRESEMVEVDRLYTMSGQPLPPINPIEVNFEGRNIFLKTKYTVKASENVFEMSNQTNGQTVGSTYPIPLVLVDKSHESAHSPIPGTRVGDSTWERHGNGETGLMFFAVSDRDRVLRIKFTINFKVHFANFDDINFFGFYFRLATYKNGSTYNLRSNRILHSADHYWDLHDQTFTFNFDEDVPVLAGDSLALVCDQNFDGENGHSAHMNTIISNITGNLVIDEDSFFEQTKAKAMLAHELGDRLVSIATNQEGAFYSEFLGRTDIGYDSDGKGALTAMTHGFWVRGFDKLPIPTEGPPKVENMFKPMTTSFKDFMTSMTAVWNVGLGVEKIGKRERIRLEELGYFYNRNVTIKLPYQVKNVKRKESTEHYFSSLEFGYELGGDYEEACGLDEFNAKSNFTTVISKLKNVYSSLSKYRADSYGMEFARRKQKSLNNTEDTRYDNHIFLLDLKRGLTSIFMQRKWQDDFEFQPTGVFSPDTATGLRFSPFNCLLRHAWRFGAGFKAYMSDKVRYGSSTANSKLKTKMIGGNEYREDGDIINSELPRARFITEEIEFEHICDFNVMQMVEGTTTLVDGRVIPNLYGTIEFENEDSEIERAFFMNLKPNGKGQWTVIKANR